MLIACLAMLLGICYNAMLLLTVKLLQVYTQSCATPTFGMVQARGVTSCPSCALMLNRLVCTAGYVSVYLGVHHCWCVRLQCFQRQVNRPQQSINAFGPERSCHHAGRHVLHLLHYMQHGACDMFLLK